MTKYFSRTRGDLVVGFWAIAPAVVIPLFVYGWWHRATGLPADLAAPDDFESSLNSMAKMLFALMFTAGALYVVALVVVIRDIWMRALDQNVRIMWTILTLAIAPLGGIVYWAVACRSRP